MRTIERYVCEICGSEYADREDALVCEAAGLPEPMPFLPLDREIPFFGENGVVYAQIRSLVIRSSGPIGQGHKWWAYTEPFAYVSHNLGDTNGLVPLQAADPRHGWDAFRYECSTNHACVWRYTMNQYGFLESEADASILEAIEQ